MKPYKILVTGGSGMLGQHLQKHFPEALFPTKDELNLLSIENVNKYLRKNKPKLIIHCAAKVGGIIDNINHPYNFFEENILINTQIIKSAITNKIPRFIGISSTCAYPDIVHKYPILEQELHSGPPAQSNFAYAYSKRAMCVQIEAANKQLGTKYNYLLPCNLYSEFDNIDNANKMHFITSLLYKIILSSKLKDKSIKLYGTGKPLRQFMYADDLAKIIKIVVNNNITHSFNVAPTNSNLSIGYMAKDILRILDRADWSIIYDKSKPDGQYRKDVSNNLMLKYIPNFTFSTFKDNIPRIYNNYVKQMATKDQKKTHTISS